VIATEGVRTAIGRIGWVLEHHKVCFNVEVENC